MASVEISNTSGGSPFLELSPEIRHLIYQYLLRTPKTDDKIYPSGRYPKLYPRLYPEVMLTCRQIYSESHKVLYGENYFSLNLWDFNPGTASGYKHYGFPKRCQHLGPGAIDSRRTLYQHAKRLQITIRKEDPSQKQGLVDAAELALLALSDIDDMHYLRIKVNHMHLTQIENILKPLGMLRNIGQVDFKGVPKELAMKLRSQMTRSSPMPKMFGELFLYANHLDCCNTMLREAMNEWEKNNFDAFKRAAHRVMAEADRHVYASRQRLLSLDEEHEEDSWYQLRHQREY